MSKLRFREVQRFTQPWVWLLLLLTIGVLVWTFGFGLVQQLVLGKPWGDQPMSDVGLVISAVIAFAFSLGFLWFFLLLALTVEVRDDCVHIHFKPLKRRTVQYRDITKVEACDYRPIVHYGGWGIRRGRKGWVYNVSGNRGVRLDFDDGTRLLIGSQRSVELAAAIETERGR